MQWRMENINQQVQVLPSLHMIKVWVATGCLLSFHLTFLCSYIKYWWNSYMQVGDLFHGWNHWYNDTVCRWCPVVSSHQLSSTLRKLHRMILIKLGTGPAPTISHSIGINANTWLFHAGKLYLTHHHHFCLEAIFWNRWKCSSIWVFSYHMISLGVNMLNVVSLGRSLAFSTEDSTIMLQIVLLYFNSTPPSLGPI